MRSGSERCAVLCGSLILPCGLSLTSTRIAAFTKLSPVFSGTAAVTELQKHFAKVRHVCFCDCLIDPPAFGCQFGEVVARPDVKEIDPVGMAELLVGRVGFDQDDQLADQMIVGKIADPVDAVARGEDRAVVVDHFQ